MDAVDLIQWPAMVVTVVASWYIASVKKRKRKLGFWLFLGSNLLWVTWGLYSHAYALVVLQVCLAGMNIRGAEKTETAEPSSDSSGKELQKKDE